MSTYRCVVCTPVKKLFDEDVVYANVPSEDGMFGVQAGHELLVSLTGRGGLCTVTPESNEKREFLIFKGASQMFNGILTILASFGIETKDIDKDEVEKHAEEMRSKIDELKAKEDVQDKTRIAIFKRSLEWDEFQLEYLSKN